MDTRVFCVYNLARRVFLSSKVTVADGASQPLTVLKMLVSSVGTDAESGLWLSPLNGTPALARIFPYDLAYLDKDHRVLEIIEVHPGIDFPPYRREVTSAVVLPRNTLRSTLTQRGDQLVVRLQQELDAILSGVDNAAAPFIEDRKPAQRVPVEPAPLAASGIVAAVALPLTEGASTEGSAAAESDVLIADLPVADNPSARAISSVSVPKAVAMVTVQQPEQAVATPVAAAAKPQSVSITEVVIEHPQAWKPQPIAGHQGIVEDLFSNWVESRSAPPAWIAEKAKPTAPEIHSPAQANAAEPVPAQAPTEAPLRPAGSSYPPAELASQRDVSQLEKTAVPTKGEAKLRNEGPDSPKTADSQVEQRTAASGSSMDRKEAAKAPPPANPAAVKPSVPVATPQPAKATTFTVAQYSRWQLSTPTGVSPIATAKRPATEGVADPSTTKTEERASAAPTKAVLPPTKSVERPAAPVAASPPAKPPEAQSLVSPALAEKKLLVASAAGKRPQIVEPNELKAKPSTPLMGNPAPKSSPESQNPKQGKAISASDSGKTLAPVPASRRDLGAEKTVEAAGEAAPAELARAVQDRLEKLLTNLPSRSAGVSAQKPGIAARKPEIAPAKAKAEATAESALAKPEILPEKTSEATKSFPPAKANPVWASTAPAKPAEKTEAAPVPHNELSMTVPLPSFLKPKADPIGKLKISVQRVETNGKNGAPSSDSLAARFKRWLNHSPESQSDRRRAHRRYVPGMVAHYFTGGAPKPYDVADISMSGFYVLTEDHWMPDTMIRMTLQKPCAKGERKQSITVLSRVVRRGRDGVAAEFVMSESLGQYTRDVMPTQGTDRFSLARFL